MVSYAQFKGKEARRICIPAGVVHGISRGCPHAPPSDVAERCTLMIIREKKHAPGFIVSGP